MIEEANSAAPEQIRAFLKKCCPGWSQRKLDTFIHTRLSQENTLIDLQDEQIRALLMYSLKELRLQHRQFRVIVIDFLAVDPRGNPQETLETFLEQLELFFEAKGFFILGEFNQTQPGPDYFKFDGAQSGVLPASVRLPNPGIKIEPYENQDLYPVYKSFMDHFDGSILLTREQFEKWLDSYASVQDDIYLSLNRKEPDGFVIVDDRQQPVKVEVLVYERMEALISLLHFLQRKYGDLLIRVGLGEDLSRIFPIHLEEKNPFFIRALHPQLHEKIGLAENAQDLFKDLDSFSWNLVLLNPDQLTR